ncbi:hypothetical protein [Roseinatronobacter monicus]|uniref:hypothetical protein n=1 Tax=Roseinatronobacter monicus TaxID=393481 RepID=UPI001152C31A|nr:hypothetical protein [Roseinatronobacter monicus]
MTLNTTLVIWATLVGAFIGVKAYAEAPLWVWIAGALWLGLAMIALLAQTSPRGRDYLKCELETANYTQVYLFVARRLNDWVWRRVGRMQRLPDGTVAPPPETTAIWPLLRAALTWRLLDRALLIAVAYPVIALILPWLLGGDAVLGAGVVVFPAAEFWPERALVLGQFAILTAGFVGQKLSSASPRQFWQSVAGWLPLIAVAFAFAFVFVVAGTFAFAVGFAGAFAGAFVVAVAVAFAFAGAVARAVVGTFAFAFAFVVPGAGAVAFAFAVAVAVAGAFAATFAFAFAFAAAFAAAGAFAFVVVVAFAVDGLWSRGRRGARMVLLGGAWALGLLAIVLFLDPSTLRADRKALFIFLAVLPLINGLFDALSYAITLALSRKGLATRWAPVWGLIDLALGAVLFLALGATIVAVIATLNAIGTAPLYDLAALFAGLRASPGDYWWLYLILFSTLAPTALHLMIAALAVQGWFVFQRPRRAVAGWIAAAPTSHPAAVGGFFGQTMIWWLPLVTLAVSGWVLWQFIGPAAGAAGLIYLDALEGLSRWIGAI